MWSHGGTKKLRTTSVRSRLVRYSYTRSQRTVTFCDRSGEGEHMAADSGFSEKSIAETERATGGAAGADLLARADVASPFDTASVDRFHQGAEWFKELAAQGQFSINEDGMQAFTRVCDVYLKGWRELRHRSRVLTQNAPMGSSEYARQISKYNAKVATGDERALIPNLELMADGFEKMKEALAVARRNYDEVESQNDNALKKFKFS